MSRLEDERTVYHVAARVGLPARTIRYYDRRGLVRASERSPSGYRLYTEEDEEKLRHLTRLRGIGLTLEEVAVVLRLLDDESTRGDVEYLLSVLRPLLRQQHIVLERLRRMIEAVA